MAVDSKYLYVGVSILLDHQINEIVGSFLTRIGREDIFYKTAVVISKKNHLGYGYIFIDDLEICQGLVSGQHKFDPVEYVEEQRVYLMQCQCPCFPTQSNTQSNTQSQTQSQTQSNESADSVEEPVCSCNLDAIPKTFDLDVMGFAKPAKADIDKENNKLFAIIPHWVNFHDIKIIFAPYLRDPDSIKVNTFVSNKINPKTGQPNSKKYVEVIFDPDSDEIGYIILICRIVYVYKDVYNITTRRKEENCAKVAFNFAYTKKTPQASVSTIVD